MGNLISPLNLTQHAVLRMAQRNISLGDLEYVLEHGERVYKTGITLYILRKRDILQDDRKKSEIARLEGTVVLTGFSRNGNLELITMYRTKSASRTFRYKPKYDHRRRFRPDRNLSSR
jgi:hypothetical protein